MGKLEEGESGYLTPNALRGLLSLTEEEIMLVIGSKGNVSIQQYRCMDNWDLDWEREDEEMGNKRICRSARRARSDEDET
jgi:hypothetical protein